MFNRFDEANEETFLKNKQKRKVEIKTKKKRKKTAKNTKSKVVLKVLCVIIALIVILGAVAAGLWFYTLFKKPQAHINNEQGGISSSDETHFTNIEGTTASKAEDVYTFLATGTDKSGGLTDVIMVANYNINKKQVSILQIPRDTYVLVSGTLFYDEKGNLTKDNFIKENSSGIKINAAYSHGRNLSEKYLNNLLKQAKGKTDEQIEKLCLSDDFAFLGLDFKKVIEYTKQTDDAAKKIIFNNLKRDFGIKYLSTLIHYNFGIPIDYHAQVNLSGFRGVVNAIDGVDLYVPQDMYYSDPTQDLYINLKKGQQHLNGDQAEDFVRFRSGYARADLARLDAQKIFMTAFLKKLFSPSTLPKIDNIITEIQKNLYTSVPLGDMLYFGQKALGIDLSTGISMTTLPGTDANIGGLSYYTANKKAVMDIVNESFNKYNEPLSEDSFLMIEIKNTPVTVVSSTVSDIENNAPDLGFLPEGEEHDLNKEQDDENIEGDDTSYDTEQEDSQADEDSETSDETELDSDDIQNSDETEQNVDDNEQNENTKQPVNQTDIQSKPSNSTNNSSDKKHQDVSETDTDKKNNQQNTQDKEPEKTIDANQALLESMMQNQNN